MMNCPGCSGWMGAGMAISWLLFVALIVVGLIVVVKAARVSSESRWDARGRGIRNPVDILEERFAHGEIDAEEFEDRRRALLLDS